MALRDVIGLAQIGQRVFVVAHLLEQLAQIAQGDGKVRIVGTAVAAEALDDSLAPFNRLGSLVLGIEDVGEISLGIDDGMGVVAVDSPIAGNDLALGRFRGVVVSGHEIDTGPIAQCVQIAQAGGSNASTNGRQASVIELQRLRAPTCVHIAGGERTLHVRSIEALAVAQQRTRLLQLGDALGSLLLVPQGNTELPPGCNQDRVRRL